MTLATALPALLTTVLAQANAGTDDDRLPVHLGLITWLVVGLIAGFLASKIVNKRGDGLVLDIILGLIGSLVGGFLIHLMGLHRNGSIILSIIVATLGAVLVLVIYHKVIRRGGPVV